MELWARFLSPSPSWTRPEENWSRLKESQRHHPGQSGLSMKIASLAGPWTPPASASGFPHITVLPHPGLEQEHQRTPDIGQFIPHRARSSQEELAASERIEWAVPREPNGPSPATVSRSGVVLPSMFAEGTRRSIRYEGEATRELIAKTIAGNQKRIPFELPFRQGNPRPGVYHWQAICHWQARRKGAKKGKPPCSCSAPGDSSLVRHVWKWISRDSSRGGIRRWIWFSWRG